MLADQIDQVKLEVADQLEAMNTYFTAGDGISLDTDRYISVTHTRPSRTDFVDPISVNFDTLLEGIAASQSVSSDVTDYGYSPGTKLYKGADGELTTNGSEEGAEQISVSAATADNLSAGTVAWVNGRLILGTGGDNKAYFDKGEKNNSGGSSDTGLSKGVAINMKGDDNKSTSYLVTENMSGVFLYMTGGDNNLEFNVLPSDPEVSCQRLFQLSGAYDNLVKSNIYYVPELKEGTQIKFSAGYAKLIKANDANQKGISSNIRGDDNKQTSYLVTEDLHDVFMICKGPSSATAKFPTFNTLPNVPIVASKKLHGATISGPGGTFTHDDIYYIPELRAGTSIADIEQICWIFY